MKPDKGIEMLTPAWNRYVEVWKYTHKKYEKTMPLRMRGYSEMPMSEIDPKERKQMHSAVLRGYRLAQNNRATQLLNLLLTQVDYSLGYSGKTQASMWFPSKEARDDCLTHLEAQTVMTEAFNAKQSLRKWNDNSFNIWINSGRWNNDQLKAHLSEARLVFDEHMDKWKDRRIWLADKIMDDSWICRVPFDSKGD